MSEVDIYKGMVKKMKDDEIKEMDKIVYDLLLKLKQCDDKHNRCDYLMEHDEITYLLDYITNLQQEKENYKSCCEKALKLVESYELGKYDYSIPAGGIVKLKDILNVRSDE